MSTTPTFEDFFRSATGNGPFPFQARLGIDGLPDRLSIPTGFGKTEAVVLGWLWRRCAHPDPKVRRGAGARLVYCLPMRVLVEQTATRVRECFERLRRAGALPSVPDVHVLLGGAVEKEWEGLPDWPAVLVGTQDQLLSRALNRGYGMSRYMWPVHFALLNNDCQWVLDEVQLMGVGLSTSVQLQMFRDAFATYGAARSIWMSATIDAGRLETVDARRRAWSELVVSDADLNHPVLRDRWNAAKPLARAESVADDAKSCASEIANAHVPGSLTLVVVNRVRRAQDLYSALHKAAPGVELSLLHSRFRPSERAAIQSRALAEGWSGILVATQAVEAGVDISARTLITELAPWPSLVQRFGRLNRRGELRVEEARALWFDVAGETDDAARPYERAELERARELLATVGDVGPASLARITTDPQPPSLPVVRRRDVLQLFDTEPDLAGHDIDVSPYIRSSADVDLQVAWREWTGDAPPNDAPEIQRDELCSVAVYELDKLTKGRDEKAWRWNGLEGEWEPVRHFVPGMVVLLRTAAGGYNETLGWTGDRKAAPKSVMSPRPGPEHDASDKFTFDCSRFVKLTEHACDAAAEMQAMVAQRFIDGPPWEALVKAARWHDLGKVHECFQEMLVRSLDAADLKRSQGPWAKSDHRGGRNSRRHFRHELASALALLERGGSDLEAYLVAAHHGKVRLTLRARPGENEPPDERLFALGVWDGDELPEVDLGDGTRVPATKLSLDYMRLGLGPRGPSWRDRTARLLEGLGPFRLAFLEALVRVADWRATARYRAPSTREAVHA
jgi:CRISPR-associated endonuclease/helicase Cas3